MMEPKNNPISVEIADPKPVQQNRCYTVDDLMTMLGMSRKSVYELLKEESSAGSSSDRAVTTASCERALSSG